VSVESRSQLSPPSPTTLPSLRHRLTRGASWSLLARIVVGLTGLAVNVVVARLLKPDALAAYFLTFSVVTVAAAVARLGLPRVVVRLVSSAIASGHPGQARAAIRRVVLLAVAASALTTIIVGGPPGRWLAGSVFDSKAMEDVMLLAALWAAMEGLRYVLSETFRGFHDFRTSAVLGDAARGALTVAALGTLLVLGQTASLSLVVAACLAASALTALLAAGFLARRMAPLGLPERLNTVVITIALPLLVADIVGLLLNQADLWVVGATRSAGDIAVYGAAGRLVVLLAVPLFVVNAVIAPVVAELHVQGKREELETTLRGATTVATIPVLVLFAVVVVAGGQVMALVFGSFARDGGLVFTILSAGQVVAVMTGSCAITLMMTGYHRTVMVYSLIALAFTIVGLLIAADRVGITGIAVVSAAGTALQNVLLTIRARQLLGIWTHASISPRNLRRFLQLLASSPRPDTT